MIIRKAKLKDVEVVAAFAVKLFKAHAAWDRFFTPSKDVDKVCREFIKRCVYSRNRYLLVAEEDGKVIGYALGEVVGRPPSSKIRKIGFISDVYVEESFRRGGVGKQFVFEFYKWFKSKKLQYIEMTVHVKNTVGKKAWAKYGFETCMEKQRVELGKMRF